jgi:hypothetical protein
MKKLQGPKRAPGAFFWYPGDMRWSRREPEDPLERLARLLVHGKRWCQVYWRQVFSYDGVEVNAAAVPIYLVQQIERDQDTIDEIATGLARASSRAVSGDPERYRARYRPLWEEAVTYVVGVRQDILRANAAGEFALLAAQQGRWMDAFRAATIAYDLEVEHAQDSRYWHPFLYSLSHVLVRLGHAHSFSDLRRLAKTPSRTAHP